MKRGWSYLERSNPPDQDWLLAVVLFRARFSTCKAKRKKYVAWSAGSTCHAPTGAYFDPNRHVYRYKQQPWTSICHICRRNLAATSSCLITSSVKSCLHITLTFQTLISTTQVASFRYRCVQPSVTAQLMYLSSETSIRALSLRRVRMQVPKYHHLATG
jgi:hypothetical protein